MGNLTVYAEKNRFEWGDACEGWVLATSNHLSIIKERMPPATMEKKHYHDLSEQWFYILEGEARFFLADSKFIIPTGNIFHIPPKQIHAIENASQVDLVFLVISSPPINHDRTEIKGISAD